MSTREVTCDAHDCISAKTALADDGEVTVDLCIAGNIENPTYANVARCVYNGGIKISSC